MQECVRCHWFTRNGVRICSLMLHLSFGMSCMSSSLHNHPEKAFYFLLYHSVQKVHCLMCQVHLTVPFGLHQQRNICCKTWCKKPVTEVCIGCHTLYWQFYQQWTDVSWCVAPPPCPHTVVPGIVCESGDIAVKYRLGCNWSQSSPSYSSLNRVCTPFDSVYLTVLPHHISRYDTCHCHVGHRYVMWECGSVSVEQ